MQESIKVWVGDIKDYKLLDSGNKKKLERVGNMRIIRSEPRAWWKPQLPDKEWQKAEAVFENENQKEWEFRQDNTFWETVIDIGIEGIKAKIRFGGKSKHIGIFPEQISQWHWIYNKLLKNPHKDGHREKNILNLFGYTGLATLAAAKAGAKATHVDASKQSVNWARENQRLSGLEKAPIRWIVDDVTKFIKKEIKQGKKYDAIIMDPPSFGRGPKGEVWKIEEKLPDLISACGEILSDKPFFVIFNMYSTELSSISIANLLSDIMSRSGGIIESGELVIKQQNSGHLLSMSIFSLWTAD